MNEEELYSQLTSQVIPDVTTESVNVNYIVCDGCGDRIPASESITIGNYTLCSECDDTHTVCNDCGTLVNEDDQTYIDYLDVYVCHSCSDSYSYCSVCESYCRETTQVMNNYGDCVEYCNNCLEDCDYRECESCQNFFLSSNGHSLCYQCRDHGIDTMVKTTTELGESCQGKICKNSIGVDVKYTATEVPMDINVTAFLDNFYGKSIGFDKVYEPTTKINHTQMINLVIDGGPISVLRRLNESINEDRFKDILTNAELLKQINLTPYKYAGTRISDYSNGILKIYHNGKETSLSVYKYIEYISNWFSKLKDTLTKELPDFKVLYVDDWLLTLKELNIKFQSPNNIKLIMSNDQTTKLNLWRDSYSMLKTCQNPSNIESFSKGFHELFTNGSNGLLMIYNGSKAIGRVLFRLFHNDMNKEGKPAIFLDRLYIQSGDKYNIFQSIVRQLEIDYDILILNRSRHDYSNYDLAGNIKMKRLPHGIWYQPKVKMNNIYHCYYQDSYTYPVQQDGDYITNILGYSGDVYLIDKQK